MRRSVEHPAVAIESLESRTLLARLDSLSVGDVETVLAQAASQARPRQAIVVSDREGIILGIFSVGGSATRFTINKAVARARTAAFFQSRQNAFTTRTARFIIQDHFPHPVPNTPGGPLYGVEFSSLFGTDVLRPEQQAQVPGQLPLNISGDPGGIPLYKNGEPVGGIGVAGDGRDAAPREDFLDIAIDDARTIFPFRIDNRDLRFYNGVEESDFDEAVALAGANDYMAPRSIRATQIFLDGLRLPFTKDAPATGQANRTFDELVASGAGSLVRVGVIPEADPAIKASPLPPWPEATFAGVAGELKNTNTAAANFGIISSDDPGPQHLTHKDVRRAITDAVARAIGTRAAIREPNGVPARVHVAVVDRDGDVLGVFRMDDGTNFSYDVAVQKARTAAFFSDNRHAFSTRGVGFVSQRFFPVGIDHGTTGPLFGLQNALSLTPGNFSATLFNGVQNPLRNGITIFPGGVPMYKNGVFVGAIGISGDGVDQDDIIAFSGGQRFAPPAQIRCDALSGQRINAFLRARVETFDTFFNVSDDVLADIRSRLPGDLGGVRLPYVKFPRNPEL